MPAANAGLLKWELLSRGDVGRLRDIGPFEVNEGLERLDRGDRCYTVSLDGRFAHYAWVNRSSCHPIEEAGVSVPVGKDEAWIYHCWTADWARGRKIYPDTLERIVSDCFADGGRTVWIYTSTQNAASQKGILRAGFALVATLTAVRVGRHYIRIGRRDRLSAAPAAREIAFQRNAFWPVKH